VPLFAADLAADHQAGRLEAAQVLHDPEAGHAWHGGVQLAQGEALALEELVE
jgi:hypothetical protein